MFLRTVDYKEDKEFFFKLKRPEEQFGLAKFSLNEIDHSSSAGELENKVSKVIPNYINNAHKRITTLRKESYAMSEILPKAVWLADDLLHNGGWRTPMGLHWRPEYRNESSIEEGSWMIHPGGTRQWVAHAFIDHDEPITFSTFNTLGKECNFDKVFTSYEELDNYYRDIYKSKLYFSLVCEYGTLIPHALASTELLELNTEKYHKLCQSRLKKFNIYFDSKWLRETLNLPFNKSKPNIIIRIKENNDVKDILGLSRVVYKSIILAILYDSYDDQEINIEVPEIKENILASELIRLKEIT